MSSISTKINMFAEKVLISEEKAMNERIRYLLKNILSKHYLLNVLLLMIKSCHITNIYFFQILPNTIHIMRI